MASVSGNRFSSLKSLLLVSSFLLASLVLVSSEKVAEPPIVDGLDYNFYRFTCGNIERIVRNHLEDVFKKDPGQAPGILRIFFHDCFSNGCDGSILVRNPNGEDERNQTANFNFREEALQTIEKLRSIIYSKCIFQHVVTCADILVIAAREAVRQLGGPDFRVPLGRRDSLNFNLTGADRLPSPDLRTDKLLSEFGKQNFDPTDVVALSGAHTFGRSSCFSLYNRTIDSEPPINPEFKTKLQTSCPSKFSPSLVNLDVRSPAKFDNLYYINLLREEGVFISDQDIAGHPETKEIVNLFASDQKAFFDKFANAFVKVSQLNVLTGKKGEVRKTCFAPNKKISNVASMVEESVELVESI